MRVFIIVLIFLVAITGCQHDPYAGAYTTTQPKTNDLVGVYIADTNTMALITNEGHYSPVAPSITLQPDSTIIISKIPDWWLTPLGQPRGGFDSGRGTWSVEKHQEWWAVSVDFNETMHFTSLSNSPGGLATDMMLVGDPDEGRGMEFDTGLGIHRDFFYKYATPNGVKWPAW
jgi:hypothetical protein